MSALFLSRTKIAWLPYCEYHMLWLLFRYVPGGRDSSFCCCCCQISKEASLYRRRAKVSDKAFSARGGRPLIPTATTCSQNMKEALLPLSSGCGSGLIGEVFWARREMLPDTASAGGVRAACGHNRNHSSYGHIIRRRLIQRAKNRLHPSLLGSCNPVLPWKFSRVHITQKG